ncbi:chalcone isomerase family protein [Chitinimonas sp.]|uniref:chalcone isomerase family protein n=1 Tax=Chitinimonas sp. TaxID=1934313 RepID=UPI002F9246E7
MSIGISFKRGFLAAACLLALSGAAQAVEVAGVQVDDSAKVANTDLKLNGAGLRTKAFFKIYVAGLYLTDKKTTPADALAAPGPKRVSLTMVREVTSDQLSQALLDGLNHNCSDEEKSRFFNQMLAIGQIFGAYRSIKPKDMINVDWVPNTGTVVYLNGKKLGEPLPDQAFYNAILKIWLGDRPAENSLKRQLLGAP